LKPVIPAVLGDVLGMAAGWIVGDLAKLQQAGLGDQVKSWIGNGQNLPIPAEQLQRCWVAHVRQLPPNSTFRSISSQAAGEQLPAAVDHASPDGRLPHTARQREPDLELRLCGFPGEAAKNALSTEK